MALETRDRGGLVYRYLLEAHLCAAYQAPHRITPSGTAAHERCDDGTKS
jgi:hypothetical protein